MTTESYTCFKKFCHLKISAIFVPQFHSYLQTILISSFFHYFKSLYLPGTYWATNPIFLLPVTHPRLKNLDRTSPNDVWMSLALNRGLVCSTTLRLGILSGGKRRKAYFLTAPHIFLTSVIWDLVLTIRFT